jgi:two-component system response regulator GlrR
VIQADHIMLPTSSTTTSGSILPYKDAKQAFEKEYYERLMRTAEGNVSLAAKIGQKTRKEIYDALKRLGLETVEFRADQPD